MRRLAYLVLTLASMCTFQAHAASELTIDGDWYLVEVVIFEQTPAGTPSSREQLLVTDNRSYPNNLLVPAFMDATNPGGGFAPFTAVAEPFPLPQQPGNVFGDAPNIGPEQSNATTEVDATANDDAAPGDAELPTDGDQLEPALPAPLSERQQLEIRFVEALDSFQQALAQDAYRWRADVAELNLANQATALARRGVGRVLAHGAWLQPVPDRAAPQPLLIQSGARVGDRYRLEGTLAITLGRFLHVAAELWYQPPANTEPSWVRDDDSAAAPIMAAIPFNLNNTVDPEQPYERLSERRRMRSGELHYLDHPRLGVLIKVDPVEPPEALAALFEELEEAVE